MPHFENLDISKLKKPASEGWRKLLSAMGAQFIGLIMKTAPGFLPYDLLHAMQAIDGSDLDNSVKQTAVAGLLRVGYNLESYHEHAQHLREKCEVLDKQRCQGLEEISHLKHEHDVLEQKLWRFERIESEMDNDPEEIKRQNVLLSDRNNFLEEKIRELQKEVQMLEESKPQKFL